MSRISYQLPLDDPGDPEPNPASWRPVTPDAIVTRRRDATTGVRAELSRDQVRWLRHVASDGPTPDALIRALVDLAMDLEVDWRRIGSARDLRAAVTDAVMIRVRE